MGLSGCIGYIYIYIYIYIYGIILDCLEQIYAGTVFG